MSEYRTYADKIAEADARNAEPKEPQPTLVLDFGDGEAGVFKAHRQANAMTLVDNAEKMYSDSAFESIKAITVLVQDQVVDDDLDSLREFLHQHGRHEDYWQVLHTALDACWSGETNLPLGRSSDSSVDTSTPETEQSSTEDSSSPATQAPVVRTFFEESVYED